MTATEGVAHDQAERQAPTTSIGSRWSAGEARARAETLLTEAKALRDEARQLVADAELRAKEILLRATDIESNASADAARIIAEAEAQAQQLRERARVEDDGAERAALRATGGSAAADEESGNEPVRRWKLPTAPPPASTDGPDEDDPLIAVATHALDVPRQQRPIEDRREDRELTDLVHLDNEAGDEAPENGQRWPELDHSRPGPPRPVLGSRRTGALDEPEPPRSRRGSRRRRGRS